MKRVLILLIFLSYMRYTQTEALINALYIKISSKSYIRTKTNILSTFSQLIFGYNLLLRKLFIYFLNNA